MSVTDERERVATLRKWGISEPLIRLSCGEVLHDLFSDDFIGPPWYVYHSVQPPDGPPFSALWERSDTVTGVWKQDAGFEFIRFSFESHDEYEVLARTEQGFWVIPFDFLYERDAPLAELRAAATAVQFRFIDLYLSERQAVEENLSMSVAHSLWLRELIARIDRSQTT